MNATHTIGSENSSYLARGPVAVLGAGTIGAGWAAFFALRGLEVRVFNTSEDAQGLVLQTLERARPTMQALGLLSESPTVPRVTTDIAQAVAGATHIQE
ncbi:MAG TPA: 3-hydroxyacyl-CoA dehydrogenase NAD-binding domain-containing protein, partial [Eoetvoesiella sp.]